MDTNKSKKGGISVETAHIFPIIKKWLYSDKDIFLREIVSNATDAVTKLRRLSSLGKYESNDEQYSIKVLLDKEAKTLTVSDNGIGMTEEEVEKYICSIALSGALDFIQKYDDGNQDNGIIGHFGLGFYSSFMIADKVELVTRSYLSDTAIRWTCDGAGEYEITDTVRDGHGTDVIMHISEEEADYLDENKIKEILNKYCSFMPVDIYFECSSEISDDGNNIDESKNDAPINDTTPLWLKNPSDCSDEEYAEFYKKVFNDYREPLFHIHINADYPLNFKGILYFPARVSEYESYEGQVKLFYNQVFVADDVKDVIPDFLLMIRGVLDCPELPLNVSRSYLQDNAYVKKVSAHIVKKVGDKLCSMCNNDRKKYENIWSEIKVFFEYAALRDRKFYDRVKQSYIFEITDGSYMTLDEYIKDCEDSHKNTVYYASDKTSQAQYISMFEAQGIKVALLSHQLDTQFISMCEMMNGDIKYKRIDSDISDMIDDDAVSEYGELEALFRKVSHNEKLNVKCCKLKDESVPALLTLSEESRRMDDMMKMYSGMGMEIGSSEFQPEYTLTLNVSSPIIVKLADTNVSDATRSEAIAGEIYGLAIMSQRSLTADELKSFLRGSFKLLEML